MPLVINGLGCGHTHTFQCVNQSNFKKPGTRGQRLRTPGLKRGIEIESEKYANKLEIKKYGKS